MSWNLRFRRRLRLAPGITMNLGKRGASLSAGMRGAHLTVGPRGRRATLGLPSTGLSLSKNIGAEGYHAAARRGAAPRGPLAAIDPHPALTALVGAVLVCLALHWLGIVHGWPLLLCASRSSARPPPGARTSSSQSRSWCCSAGSAGLVVEGGV